MFNKNNFYLILLCGAFALYLLFIVDAQGSSLKEVKKWCNHYDYDDCAMVKAIAMRESNLNPLAYHPENSGSYGLMQIQCDLAKDSRLKSPLKYSCDQLFNPQINIRFGIQYLKLIKETLIDVTSKNILAAYNAGFDGNSKKCVKSKAVLICSKYSKKDKKCVTVNGHEICKPVCIEHKKNIKCLKYKFNPRICKNYNKFKYEGFPVMECFPGEYLNEEYVWKVFRLYRYYKLQELRDGQNKIFSKGI